MSHVEVTARIEKQFGKRFCEVIPHVKGSVNTG
jgi:hypothetical protein